MEEKNTGTKSTLQRSAWFLRHYSLHWCVHNNNAKRIVLPKSNSLNSVETIAFKNVPRSNWRNLAVFFPKVPEINYDQVHTLRYYVRENILQVALIRFSWKLINFLLFSLQQVCSNIRMRPQNGTIKQPLDPKKVRLQKLKRVLERF